MIHRHGFSTRANLKFCASCGYTFRNFLWQRQKRGSCLNRLLLSAHHMKKIPSTVGSEWCSRRWRPCWLGLILAVAITERQHILLPMTCLLCRTTASLGGHRPQQVQQGEWCSPGAEVEPMWSIHLCSLQVMADNVNLLMALTDVVRKQEAIQADTQSTESGVVGTWQS